MHVKLWRVDDALEEIAFESAAADVAAQLMGLEDYSETKGIRTFGKDGVDLEWAEDLEEDSSGVRDFTRTGADQHYPRCRLALPSLSMLPPRPTRAHWWLTEQWKRQLKRGRTEPVRLIKDALVAIERGFPNCG